MARPEVRFIEGSKDVHYRVKIGLPVIHFQQVLRPRLNIVSDALKHRITWISAPAGYGKTTALVQSVRSAKVPAAWLTLDDSDNELSRFWEYLSLAILEIAPDHNGPYAEILRSPDVFSAKRFIDGLLDHLQQSEGDTILILDNIHCLKNPAVLNTISFFIRYLPDQVHVILSGRLGSIPSSSRMAVAHEIRQLTHEALRFTPGEIEDFCRLAGLSLDPASMETLMFCSEGWPAGVAGLLEPLIDGRETALLKPDCSNLNDELAAYIAGEIVVDLSDAEIDFLVKTSILPKLTPAFCQALTGIEDCSGMLNTLSRDNLLLDPIPGQSDHYRLHRLLRVWFNRRLQQQYGETVRFLYASAADWHESRGELDKAFRYLKRSGDMSRLAAFVRLHGPDLLRTGESRTLLGWLNALPRETVEADELLSFFQAWTALIHRHSSVLEKTLGNLNHNNLDSEGQIIRPLESRAQSELMILDAMRSYAGGDHARAAEQMVLAAGVTRSTLLFSGGIDLTDGQVTLIGGLLGGYGNISRLDDHFFGSLKMIEDAWGSRGIRQILTGELLYEQNQLAEACPHFMQGLREAMFFKCNGGLTAAVIGISRLRRAGGDMAGAIEIVRIGRNWQTKHGILHQYPPLDAWQSLLECEMGDEASATEWIRRSRLESSPTGADSRIFEYLILARILLSMGHLESCENLLSELNVVIEAEPSTWYEIKILILRAVCRQRRGSEVGALADLRQALMVGQREGYYRIFLDEGGALKGLLRALLLERSGKPDWPESLWIYAGRIHDAINGSKTPSSEVCSPWPGLPKAKDALTMRELEVLRRMSMGRSNKEIAEELHVSLATVKFHSTNIYRKLNVTRRQSAILAGIENKLI